MAEFTTGQQLLAVPEIKRYVLTSLFSEEQHLVTEEMLRNAFGDKYVMIMANRSHAWFVSDYFE